jgi:transposase-like protein
LREQRMTKAAELVEGGIEETLAYYAFPEEHWRRIRTNNSLECILRETRRRTRVVGAFPDGQSALNLAAARLRHIAGSLKGKHRQEAPKHSPYAVRAAKTATTAPRCVTQACYSEVP